MATLTATAAQANAPAVMNIGGATVREVRYTLNGVALSAGDVIQMLKVPSGARITDLTFAVDAIGGAGTSSYTIGGIGDGNAAGRYLGSFSVVTSVVSRLALPAAFGYSYSAEDTIDITVGTVTSGTAATAIVQLVVHYYNQDTGKN